MSMKSWADAQQSDPSATSAAQNVRIKPTRRAAQVTSTPDTAPPQLLCPECDHPLAYRKTVIGGVKPIERWHYFACQTCGAFVYRDRTRKLRPAIA